MPDQTQMPKGWRSVRLGDVAEVNPRRLRLRVPAETPVTFLPMAAIAERSIRNYSPGISSLFRGLHRVHLL